MKAIARASGLILALTVLVPGALAGCGELSSGRPGRAVTIRVRCGPVQPGPVQPGALQPGAGTDGDGGVLDRELPVALAQ